ncbi:MAG: hypothetical protein ACRD72_23840 [Candidatus Angelobacter sp.]
MKAVGHISFFQGHGVTLLWHQQVDAPTKEAIEKFEAALRSLEASGKAWEEIWGEALAALTPEERGLLPASPSLRRRPDAL